MEMMKEDLINKKTSIILKIKFFTLLSGPIKKGPPYNQQPKHLMSINHQI